MEYLHNHLLIDPVIVSLLQDLGSWNFLLSIPPDMDRKSNTGFNKVEHRYLIDWLVLMVCTVIKIRRWFGIKIISLIYDIINRMCQGCHVAGDMVNLMRHDSYRTSPMSNWLILSLNQPELTMNSIKTYSTYC